MKIGIITMYYNSKNCGGLLQAFALQKVIEELGETAEQICYLPVHLTREQEQEIRKIALKKRAYLLMKLIQDPSYLRTKLMGNKRKKKTYGLDIKDKLKIQDDVFERFEQIIPHSTTVYDEITLKGANQNYDAFICGSDQVWSLLLDNDENQAFYLNFGDKDTKRIAYAASFGRDVYPMELNSKLHDMLAKFDAVSVREKTGINICKKVGIQAVDVLDPTLLLTTKEYVQIIEKPSVKEKYFYTYSLNITSEKDLCWKALLDYANRHGFKSVSTTSSGYFIGKEICSNTEYVYATIPQWLGYIQNAEFVATTSFHGVVFCLIMHTNFIYFPLKGTHSRGNSRVVSLLDYLGLHEKIFDGNMTIKQCIERPIDWNKVRAKLNIRKNDSINFLENCLH